MALPALAALPRSLRARLALPGALVLLAAFYLWLAAARLGPLEGFWCGDQGVKLLQVEGLLGTRFRSLSLPYPGQALDPERRFAPFRGQFLLRRGEAYPIFPPAFAALSAPPYALLGPPGLLLLPGISTLFLLALAGALARRFLPPWGAAAAVLALGAASPLLFYALAFWEHAPAACLTTLALWAAVRWRETGRHAWLAGAGLAVALAAALRNEAILAAPALAAGLLAAGLDRSREWRESRGAGDPRLQGPGKRANPDRLIRDRRHGSTGNSPLGRRVASTRAWLSAGWRPLLALGLGCALGLAPLLAFNQRVYGHPLGAHVVIARQAVSSGHLRMDRLAWVGTLIAPLDGGLPTLALVLLAMAACAAPFARRRRRALAGCAAALAGAAAAALLATRPSSLITSLLASFPLTLLALIPPPQSPVSPGGEAPANPSPPVAWDAQEDPGPAASPAATGAWVPRLLAVFCAVDLFLAWLGPLPEGGVQWGPRMLLPAIPALGLLATARVLAWLRAREGLLRLGVATAALLCLAASLAAAARGVYWARESNRAEAAFTAQVAATGERLVVTSSAPGVSLLAPLFYRGPLIFQVDSWSGPDAFLPVLARSRAPGFLFLWRPGDGGNTGPVPGFQPRTPPFPLPFGFEAQAFLREGVRGPGGEWPPGSQDPPPSLTRAAGPAATSPARTSSPPPPAPAAPPPP